MREIPLRNSPLKAIVDDEDYQKTVGKTWSLTSKGYVVHSYRQNGKSKKLRLSRVVMDAPRDKFIDHKFHDLLDNRKAQLRIVTVQQNGFNSVISKRRGKTSRFKGVSKNGYGDKWDAYITINKKVKRLGSFPFEADAAREYNRAALKFYGEFALLNPIY